MIHPAEFPKPRWRLQLVTNCFSVALLAMPLSAQRSVNLTGKPLAALSEGLTKISGVRELSGNRALVTDRDENALRLADFAANDLRSIGTKGDGPNEYRLATELYPMPASGSVMTGMGRVYQFSADAKITAVFPEPGNETGLLARQTILGADQAGRLYFLRRQRYDDDSAAVIRWQPHSSRVDTVAIVAAPRPQTGTIDGSGHLRLSPDSPKALEAGDVWVVLPDGRVAGVRGNPYRIDFADHRQITRGPLAGFTPRSVTAADRAAFNAQRAKERMAGASGGPNAPAGGVRHPPPLEDADFAKVMPPFVGGASIRVTPEGEIWVLRARAVTDSIPTYDIFDPTGKLIGKATLKPHSTVVSFGNGTVYIAREDPADDLRYLEKYAR
ncbi:MAG: hypothetical protein V4558_04985 [Gemmatimonadota bacterium]